MRDDIERTLKEKMQMEKQRKRVARLSQDGVISSHTKRHQKSRKEIKLRA